MFTDDSPEIKKYSFDKIIDKIVVGPNQLMQDVRRCILNILKQPVETLARLGIFYHKNPELISPGSVVLTMRKVMKDKPANLNVCINMTRTQVIRSYQSFMKFDKIRNHIGNSGVEIRYNPIVR
jgi:ERCC4-related helicase